MSIRVLACRGYLPEGSPVASSLRDVLTSLRRRPSGEDLEFMHELMQKLEADDTPAPAPIEQRWSAASSAPMSPAAMREHSDELYSWVGIVMYLPTEEKHARQAITNRWASMHACKVLAGCDM